MLYFVIAIAMFLAFAILICDPNNIPDYGFRFWKWS